MRLDRLVVGLLFCWSIASNAQAVVEAKLRPRVKSAFSTAVCAHTFPSHPLEVWKMGIYESQIIGKAYEPFRGKRLTKEFLGAQSKSLAKKHNHLSRIWGLCENGTGWVGSWPAPEPMRFLNSGQFAIPVRSLDSQCVEYRVDYADKVGGQPKRINLGDAKLPSDFVTVDTSSLPPGTFAVTCYPKQPSWQGPVMWYFAPVKSGPSASVPLADRLYGKRDLRQNIIEWVNAVRNEEGLKPLEPNDKSLNAHALALTMQADLIHDRRELEAVAKDLQQDGKNFLGENRFQGQSNLEVGWLLWNSPRHRALILSKKGTHLGVAAKNIGDNRFGVLIVAQ